MKILLVEDNQDNADLFIRILKTADYEVTHTLRGLEGLKLARQQQFSAILLDFDLPDINGMQVCLAIRKSSRTVPIIALTAKADRSTREQARLFGFDAFITKPCLDKDLLQTIESAVQQAEAQATKAAADAHAVLEAKALAEARAQIRLQAAADEQAQANIQLKPVTEVPTDLPPVSETKTSTEPVESNGSIEAKAS
jgi:DNA-binding response OmpR family regulator